MKMRKWKIAYAITEISEIRDTIAKKKRKKKENPPFLNFNRGLKAT